jgi:hypothetical protein
MKRYTLQKAQIDEAVLLVLGKEGFAHTRQTALAPSN